VENAGNFARTMPWLKEKQAIFIPTKTIYVPVAKNVLKNVPVVFWTWLKNYGVNTAPRAVLNFFFVAARLIASLQFGIFGNNLNLATTL
jgi:hypothetical protein